MSTYLLVFDIESDYGCVGGVWFEWFKLNSREILRSSNCAALERTPATENEARSWCPPAPRRRDGDALRRAPRLLDEGLKNRSADPPRLLEEGLKKSSVDPPRLLDEGLKNSWS